MYNKTITDIKETHLYNYKKEEHAELWKERYEFVTFELVLPILKATREPKTWKKVGLLAVHEYERQIQLFQDSKWGHLITVRNNLDGDGWINPRKISSSIGRKRIAQMLEVNGYYLARPPGQGIELTADPVVIDMDYTRNASAVKTRGKNLSKTATRANESIAGVNLPIVLTEIKLMESEISN